MGSALRGCCRRCARGGGDLEPPIEEPAIKSPAIKAALGGPPDELHRGMSPPRRSLLFFRNFYLHYRRRNLLIFRRLCRHLLRFGRFRKLIRRRQFESLPVLAEQAKALQQQPALPIPHKVHPAGERVPGSGYPGCSRRGCGQGHSRPAESSAGCCSCHTSRLQRGGGYPKEDYHKTPALALQSRILCFYSFHNIRVWGRAAGSSTGTTA